MDISQMLGPMMQNAGQRNGAPGGAANQQDISKMLGPMLERVKNDPSFLQNLQKGMQGAGTPGQQGFDPSFLQNLQKIMQGAGTPGQQGFDPNALQQLQDQYQPYDHDDGGWVQPEPQRDHRPGSPGWRRQRRGPMQDLLQRPGQKPQKPQKPATSMLERAQENERRQKAAEKENELWRQAQAARSRKQEPQMDIKSALSNVMAGKGLDGKEPQAPQGGSWIQAIMWLFIGAILGVGCVLGYVVYYRSGNRALAPKVSDAQYQKLYNAYHIHKEVEEDYKRSDPSSSSLEPILIGGRRLRRPEERV